MKAEKKSGRQTLQTKAESSPDMLLAEIREQGICASHGAAPKAVNHPQILPLPPTFLAMLNLRTCPQWQASSQDLL